LKNSNVLSLFQPSSLAKVKEALNAATNYAQWKVLAARHDQFSGMQEWRGVDRTRLYDYQEIRRRHARLTALLKDGDPKALLLHLNEGVHGNMGGMGAARLYHRSMLGTKHLIEEYIDLQLAALDCICEDAPKHLSEVAKVDFIRRASHCYGRTALMLSGGAGLIYFHHGVVAELAEQGCMPNVISGASAGSWVCVQVGALTDQELAAGYLDKQRYPQISGKDIWSSICDRSGQQASQVRTDLIDSFCGKMTFQEAYEHTGRYINIAVAPVERHQKARLLNAITAPNVTLRSAAMASSSVPGLIDSVQLECKDTQGRLKPYLPTRRWVDGSMTQDLPAKRLARLYGVNHSLVSLINPLALPFTKEPALHSNSLKAAAGRFIHNISLELLKLSQTTLEKSPRTMPFGNLISTGYHLLDQDYTGDINFMLNRQDYRRGNTVFMYKDNDIENLILAGRRSVWPRIAQTRNALCLSQKLDELLVKVDPPTGMQRFMVH
jgi:TAG lipase/steryl ester hydrolase/phospholipase A2/LPA acyltransferase